MGTSLRGADSDVGRRLAESIRKRRTQLGLTQQELARRAGFSVAQTISAIERGERDVKAVELAAIAQALYCALTDLFEEPKTRPTVAWRKRPDDEGEIEEARFLRLCEYYHLAEQWAHDEHAVTLPEVRPPRGKPSLEWARMIGDRVRDQLGLGSLPAASLRQTLEEHCGVKIFFLPSLRGSAACTRGEFGAAVVLNASEVPWRRNYSLAHELFHLVTWEFLGPQQADAEFGWPERTEQLAEAFASSLLLPETALRESLDLHRQDGGITVRSLVEVAREFDVSTEALLWRLVSLGMLTDKRVRELLDNPAFRSAGRPTFAPVREPEILPERFLRLLETAYLQGEVSAGRIAEMTGQSLGAVHHRLAQIEEDEASAGQLVRLA